MSQAALPVVICDDSLMARKQMAKALKNWNVDISFATNGEEALTAIEAGLGDILFLDLNMPVMDGYETLENIRARDLPSLVIVVSGDIQAEAQTKVKQLGAMEFIKKPIDAELLSSRLKEYGLLSELESGQDNASSHAMDEQELSLANFCQEISNVAMGRAAELLSKVMNTFINMPIPKVHMFDYGQFVDYLADVNQQHSYLVSQSFVTRGVAGEALVGYKPSCVKKLAQLMQRDPGVDSEDLVRDVTNLLGGAFLRGLGEQIDMDFSDMPPTLVDLKQKRDKAHPQWSKAMGIELNYEIKEHDLQFQLLLMFTEDSLPAFEERARFM